MMDIPTLNAVRAPALRFEQERLEWAARDERAGLDATILRAEASMMYGFALYIKGAMVLGHMGEDHFAAIHAALLQGEQDLWNSILQGVIADGNQASM